MKSPKSLLQPEINLTPLVDLYLVLLILLVVVAPMLRPDEPPRPGSASASSSKSTGSTRTHLRGGPPERLDQLAVAISADGAVFIDQKRVEREELPEILSALHMTGPRRPVLIKGDRRLPYREVRQLMEQFYRAGFQRVALLAGARQG